MKSLLIVFLFFTISFTGNAQSFEVWGSAGAKYKLNKKIQFSGSFSSRFRDLKAKTIFPQLTVKYKIVKWVNVSIDYRYVAKRENNGNYIGANRVNMNAKFNYNIDRFSLGFRTRYQMSSEKGSSSSYNSDFDRAIRFKPSLAYDIKKSIFTPTMSVEFFYNPGAGVLGQRIDKMRYTIGTDLELDGPHSIGVFARIDQKIYDSNPIKFIVGLNYDLSLNKILKSYKKKGDL